MTRFNTEFINRPFPVYWAGFKSSTVEMQRHGWQIDIMEDITRAATRFVFRHPEIEGVATNILTWEVLIADRHSFNVPMRLPLELHFGKDIYTDSPGQYRGMRFEPVGLPMDARFAEQSGAVPIGRLGVFSKLQRYEAADDDSRVVVPQDTVPELLDRIRELQAPNQKEILQKIRKQEAQPASETNIIAIA